MRAFLLILSFFTRIPVGHRVEYSDELYETSIKYFPYIGMVIGLLCMVPYVLFKNVNSSIVSVLVILAYLIVTGGIHLDGLADSMDGLFSNRDRERVLEIMKDSRIGSFGVIGLILYFLIFYTTVKELPPVFIFLMPFVGKSSGAFAAGFTGYARKTPGMGTVFVESHNMATSGGITVACLAISYLLAGSSGVLAGGLTLVLAYLMMKWIEGKIGGMTGDTIGFVVEVCQVAFLLISVIVY